MNLSNTPDVGLSFPLFVPADRPELFCKACASGTDAVIIDFEDSVAPESKPGVRRIPESALPAARTVSLYLRVNGVGTKWHRDDVAFARATGFDGVVLPKVESAEQVTNLRQALGEGRTIIALIETVRGLSRVEDIALAADRLAFGSIDLSEDLGCGRTRLALLPLRSRIVQAARLAGRPAPLDGVTISTDDPDLIEDDAAHASEMGFGGKLLIHPRQIEPSRAGFSAEFEDLDWARKMVAAAGDGLGGDGESSLSPAVARARRMLIRRKTRV